MDARTTAAVSEPARAGGLLFPFPEYPEPGAATEVADGIFWISTKVPFVGLKQVNVWLLRDGEGWTMIDCGYSQPDTREQIAETWRRLCGGRPVTRLIVTHFHPDHAGNSRWISEHWKLRMEMSQREWFAANLAILNRYSDQIPARATFYRRHGLDEARLEQFLSQAVLYRDGVELPQDYRRLSAGDVLAIGGDRWTVITGEGHSPEHVSLYCATRRILIAGDQILPAITTNVSTWQVEPEFDAVGAFLRTCKTFLGVLDRDALILPSHRRPFRNVHDRLRELAYHHAARCNIMLDHAGSETDAGALIDVLFTPGLDGHQIGFAMGETIAHLNHLVTLGHMRMIETEARVHYRRISPPGATVQPEFE
jgi:glyoxylase-like metal-dependent hydrolase (beta-lactamase superfamily II)